MYLGQIILKSASVAQYCGSQEQERYFDPHNVYVTELPLCATWYGRQSTEPGAVRDTAVVRETKTPWHTFYRRRRGEDRAACVTLRQDCSRHRGSFLRHTEVLIKKKGTCPAIVQSGNHLKFRLPVPEEGGATMLRKVRTHTRNWRHKVQFINLRF